MPLQRLFLKIEMEWLRVRQSLASVSRRTKAIWTPYGDTVSVFKSGRDKKKTGRSWSALLDKMARAGYLFQLTYVCDKFLDLIVGQFAFLLRHLAFAFLGDFDQLRVTLLGNFGRVEIADSHFLSGRRALAVSSMAHLAFRFVQRLGIVSERRAGDHGQSQHNQQGEQRLHCVSSSIHINPQKLL